jgi:hypothetical protein
VQDHKTISRNFSMLTNLVILKDMDRKDNPRKLKGLRRVMDPQYKRAEDAETAAETMANIYVTKFLASGAPEKGASAHALPDELARAAGPANDFLEREAHKRRQNELPQTVREKALAHLSEFSSSHPSGIRVTTTRIISDPQARSEVKDLEILLSQPALGNIAKHLLARETGDPGAAVRIRDRINPSARPDHSRLLLPRDRDMFSRVSDALTDFRRQMKKQLAAGKPMFDPAHNPNTAAHDPAAHGPRVDWARVKGDANARRAKILRNSSEALRPAHLPFPPNPPTQTPPGSRF